MRLDFEVNGNAGRLTGITRLEIDGKLYGEPAAPPVVSPPEPSPGDKLVAIYFSGDRLGADVAFKKPPYIVVADIPAEQAADPEVALANRLPGSGDQMPAILYATDKDRADLMILKNPEHPYFNDVAAGKQLTKAHVETLTEAAPTVQTAVKAATTGANPLTLWETAQNTTSPADMSFAIMYIGPGGERSRRMAEGYRLNYYQTWGRQAPGSSINREQISDAELTYIRSIPKSVVAALAAGDAVDFDYHYHP